MTDTTVAVCLSPGHGPNRPVEMVNPGDLGCESGVAKESQLTRPGMAGPVLYELGLQSPKAASLKIAGHRFVILTDPSIEVPDDPVAGTYRNGELSPVLPALELTLKLLRPGARVLDLGAHVGGFALAAAALGFDVLAVEASPAQAELIRMSVARNQFHNLHVIHAVAGDQTGSTQFRPYGPYGHVGAGTPEVPSLDVPAVEIDKLMVDHAWGQVHFIKLDVEGSEVKVVRGMRRLLHAADAPPIYFESNRFALAFYGETPGSLGNELMQLGYRIYRGGSRFTHIPDLNKQRETVVDYLAIKGPLPRSLRLWAHTLKPLIRRALRKVKRATCDT
jgi:FkbM family methyltransferase